MKFWQVDVFAPGESYRGRFLSNKETKLILKFTRNRIIRMEV